MEVGGREEHLVSIPASLAGVGCEFPESTCWSRGQNKAKSWGKEVRRGRSVGTGRHRARRGGEAKSLFCCRAGEETGGLISRSRRGENLKLTHFP